MRDEAKTMARDVFQEVGEVVAVTADALRVRTASGTFEAKRAASCLLRPAVTDRVLLAVPGGGPLYVLAVLEREAGGPSEIELGDDARLRGRRVTVAAEEGVSIRGGASLHATAEAVTLSAERGVFSVGRATWRGRLLDAWIDVARTLSEKLDTHVQSLTVHAGHSLRVVEGADVTRAGSIETQAEGTVHLRGENAFVSAEELVKVDGELIHLG